MEHSSWNTCRGEPKGSQCHPYSVRTIPQEGKETQQCAGTGSLPPSLKQTIKKITKGNTANKEAF